MDDERRRPHWVYRGGAEPDYRFSLANERTFLAWIRTSLAFLAAGVALGLVDLDGPQWAQDAAADVLVVLALLAAGASWFRWALAEREMRSSRSLPGIGLLAIGFTAGVVVAVVVTLVALG